MPNYKATQTGFIEGKRVYAGQVFSTEKKIKASWAEEVKDAPKKRATKPRTAGPAVAEGMEGSPGTPQPKAKSASDVEVI